MKRVVLSVAALALGLGVSVVAAQEKAKTMTAVGPVTKIAKDTLSVDTGKGVLEFTTSADTEVKVTGGSSKARAAALAGEKGVKITDAIHEGDQVSVKYTEAGGKLMASAVEVLERRPAQAQPVK
jgi:hypothetical protein